MAITAENTAAQVVTRAQPLNSPKAAQACPSIHSFTDLWIPWMLGRLLEGEGTIKQISFFNHWRSPTFRTAPPISTVPGIHGLRVCPSGKETPAGPGCAAANLLPTPFKIPVFIFTA